ncbi:MAG TPA: hypothetical protein ENK88_06350, partial [Campylobacterales bacterium]|nr:hypothetical protein [Campylobacterales bacterium]
QNLSVELEKAKSLTNEKDKLENRVKSLEQNITTQTDEKAQLVSKVNELKSSTKKEIEKITQEYNNKLQTLEAQKASIEQNLSNAIEKSQQSIDENSKLKKEFTEQKTALEQELNSTKSQLQELKSEKEKAIKKAEAKQTLLKTFSLTNVQFKRGSGELTDESKARLDNTAQKMKEYPNFKYEIQGHTDKSGKEEFNIKLSAKRAEKTKEYLIEKGIPADILTTKGFGSSQPIADNETKEGRGKNRRVIFIIKD